MDVFSAIPSGIGDYPVELDDRVTLPNLRRVRIRALRRCEEGPIRELDASLSVRTRYARFLSPFPMLPDSLVRLLSCVDYQRTLALIAQHDKGSNGEIVGLASFGAIDEGSAELGLLVRDDWQRQRVGTELATRVLLAAERRGFRRFVVHMSADNVAIRRLLRNVGEIVWTKASGGIVDVLFVRRRAA